MWCMYVSVAYTLSDMGAVIVATLAQDSGILCLQVARYSISIVSSELHSSDKDRATGKKGPATELELGPMLYRGVSATRAINPSQDPLSPIYAIA